MYGIGAAVVTANIIIEFFFFLKREILLLFYTVIIIIFAWDGRGGQPRAGVRVCRVLPKLSSTL